MSEYALKDGSLYRVDTVLATKALLLKARLLKIAGGAMDRLPAILAGRGKDDGDETASVSDSAALAALGDMLSKIDPVDVVQIIGDVVALGSIQPHGSTGWHKANLDAHFSDRKADLYPVVIFTLRETFGDFFTGLPVNGILRRAKTVAH